MRGHGASIVGWYFRDGGFRTVGEGRQEFGPGAFEDDDMLGGAARFEEELRGRPEVPDEEAGEAQHDEGAENLRDVRIRPRELDAAEDRSTGR